MSGCRKRKRLHEARAVRQESELLGQRAGDRGRHVEIRGRELTDPCRALDRERSSELLEKERIAAALLIDGGRGLGVDRFTEQLASPRVRAPMSTRWSDPARRARSSVVATRSGA
jgi:hypothetical protein